MSTFLRIRLLTSIVALSVGVLLVLPSFAFAESFTVNTSSDELDGSCSDSDCSLRDAISLAADNGGGDDLDDTITIDDDIETITMSLAGADEDANATGDFDLVADNIASDQSLTINGNATTIDGNSLDRLFHVINSSGAAFTVTIDETVLTGGDALSGAVVKQSVGSPTTITLSNTAIHDIQLSTDVDDVSGALIDAECAVELVSTTIENTEVAGDNRMEGLIVTGETQALTLSDVQINNTTIDAPSSSTGLIDSSSDFTADELLISNTTINSGFMVDEQGMLVVRDDSTISNTAIVNTNITLSDESDVAVVGALIFSDEAEVAITHFTAANTTIQVPNDDGGASPASSSLIYAAGSSVLNLSNIILTNTLYIAGETEAVLGCDTTGESNFTGINIDEGDTCETAADSGADTILSNTDADVEIVTDTVTGLEIPLPTADSPAFDAIAAEDCEVDTDARGVSRPQGDGCEVGAIERQADGDGDGVTADVDCDDDNADISENQTYYEDADGDGLGNPGVTTSVCSLTAPAGYVSNNSDDDDSTFDAPATITDITGLSRGRLKLTYSDDSTSTIRVFTSYAGDKKTLVKYLAKRDIYLITHPLGKMMKAMELSNDETELNRIDQVKLSKKAKYQKLRILIAKKRIQKKKVLAVLMNNTKKTKSKVVLIKLNKKGRDNVFMKKAGYGIDGLTLKLKRGIKITQGINDKTRLIVIATKEDQDIHPTHALLLYVKKWILVAYE